MSDHTKLHETTNAETWAQAFADIHAPDVEHDLLRAWFANAIETGRQHGYSAAMKEMDPNWPISVIDGDPVMVFRRSEIIQYLGQWALPPWADDDGTMLGARIDCAALGAKLIAALDAIDIRQRVPSDAPPSTT